MDWLKKCTGLLGKYRYVVLILVIGLVLMLLPTSAKKDQETSTAASKDTMEKTISEELEEILGRINGVGNVKVMLTLQAGEQVLYQYDEKSNGRDTVIINGTDKVEQGLIRQINPPVYRGAIIVCDGADSAGIRLDIIQAVSAVTGLSSDRITVLKMK